MEAVLNGPFGRNTLGPTPFTIGRAADNQLVVNDPKSSSHHAEIRLQAQGYDIIDLGSTNGTFINEQQLAPNVPRLLAAGDKVRIGDTIFTYEVTGMTQFEPTEYAAYGQGNAGYPPTVIAPPSFTGYGSDPQQGASQVYQPPPPPPPAYQAYPYAPPAQPYAQQSMNPPGMPGYAAPVAVARPGSRRGLWIVLGAVGGVLLIVILLFAVIAVTASTPTKTLNAFCNGLKNGDYQTAYNQLSSSLQSRESESQFAAAASTNGTLGRITDCTVSNVNDSLGTGTISYTVASGQTVVDDYILIKENNTWKINAQQPHP